MRGNERRLLSWRVYVIIDVTSVGDRDPVAVAKAAVRGGADAIQLRGKQLTALQLWRYARRMQLLCRRGGAIFIVNDRPDVAVAVDADGVHLGQDDLPVSAVRSFDRRRALLVGVSTHSVVQAERAQRLGVDYIGVGPIFTTPTKPDYSPVGLRLIRQVRARVSIPQVVIGGIDEGNIGEVVSSGASCVAVVRAVCAADNPLQATRCLRHAVVAELAAASAVGATSS